VRAAWYMNSVFYSGRNTILPTVPTEWDLVSVADIGGQPCRAAAVAIAIGASVAGELDGTDCTVEDGSRADRYTFTVSGTQKWLIDMTSNSIYQPWLALVNASGTILATNTATGSSTSQIEAVLNAGTYTIWASSSYRYYTGAYTLSVRAACQAAAYFGNDPDFSVTKLADFTALGSLQTTDCQTVNPANPLTGGNVFADRWMLRLSQRTDLQLDMSSAFVNAYLSIFNTAGVELVSDDNGGGGTFARIRVVLNAGDYVVMATSSVANQTGSYSLSVKGACSTLTPIGVPGTPAGTVVSVSGALESSDCLGTDTNTDFYNRYADTYTFTLDATNVGTLEFNVTSTSFDPSMALISANGSKIANDGDSGGGPNSWNPRITRTLVAGTYRIRVHGYSVFAGGSYTVSLTRR
jgi:hypothetical protein